MDLLFPSVAYAQSTDFDSFLANVNLLIINPLIVLLFALAIIYFLYGVFEFIINLENDEKRTTGKMHMIYGIIGITIMMGVFTIERMILNTFNITGINPADNSSVNLTP